MEIYKYRVMVDDTLQSHELSQGSKILHVATLMDPNKVYFWATHDPGMADVVRRFLVVGTGHRLPDLHTYLGTAIAIPFVWHLLEIP